MKLIRYQIKENKPIHLGIVLPQGILPLDKILENPPDNFPELFSSTAMKILEQISIPPQRTLTPLGEVRILPPIQRPGKILCVGLNYRDHVLEGGREFPEYPTIFMKASSSIIGPKQSILLPTGSQMVDFEAELAVVIGTKTHHCPEETAYEHIAGYTILNDVSARDYQRRTSQWTLGKSCDTFAPTGPLIVTKEEIPDPHSLQIRSTLNSLEMQNSNTKHLIFRIPFLIHYISDVMTLEPGDIIATGTPGGVGVFREPPVFLQQGDTVTIMIEKIGTLSNPVQEAVV